MITPQTQAANIANTLMSMLAGLSAVQVQVDAISAEWTNLSAANMLNAFPTTVLLTTGALGTADGSPNTAHVIDTRTPDGELINRAISATDLASILTALQLFSTMMKGGVITQNGAIPSLVAKVS